MGVSMTNSDVYDGESDVFVIFTGLGGSPKGYENKYVTLSKPNAT